MGQVNSSPGVPRTLATVVASSASPILASPPLDVGTNILGTGVVSTGNVLSWTSSTGASNVWPAVLTERATVVPFTSSTPIIYGPAIFNGNPFVASGS